MKQASPLPSTSNQSRYLGSSIVSSVSHGSISLWDSCSALWSPKFVCPLKSISTVSCDNLLRLLEWIHPSIGPAPYPRAFPCSKSSLPPPPRILKGQPCRQGSGQMCTELIFGMIPRNFFTASGVVLCVGLHRETNSFSHPKPFIFTEIMSPTGIDRAAGLSLALLPCRQACRQACHGDEIWTERVTSYV